MIAFGAYTFDAHARRLSGPDGTIELTSRAVDLLAALLAAPDQVLDKDALFAAAWPGLIVEDNTLQVHISALRKALGQGYIATIHGRGYKYAGPPPDPVPLPAAPAPRAEVRGNIERFRSDCVARESELASLAALVGQHRLVSVIGPGGVGKTTLAAAVAAAQPTPPGGTWLVDLAGLADGEHIGSTLIQTLGVPFRANQTLRDSLALHLRQAEALLVFDNCEHVRETIAGVVRDLLADVPTLRMLTTSQVPLGLPEERLFRLAPFAVDAAADGPAHADRFLAYCYELFGEALSERDRPVIARLCRRLDGLALALKMAAARGATLGLETIDSQLAAQMADLRADWNASLARHRSLTASLTWSYDLLAEKDRRLLRMLAVFQGGFSLDAVRAVDGEGAENRLAELLRRSLVVRDGADRDRLRLLDSTRRFALEQLQAAGDEQAARRAHCAWVTGHFAASIVAWESLPDDAWRVRFARDGDNLRAALAWAKSSGDTGALVALAANSWRYFTVEQLGDEGVSTIEETLPYADSAGAQDRARLQHAMGEVCRFTAKDIRAREALLPALAWFRGSDDRIRYWQALVLFTWGTLFFRSREEGDAVVAELRAQLQHMPDSKTKAWGLVASGVHAWRTGEKEVGLVRAEAGLAMHAAMGNPIGRFRSVMNLSEMLHNGGATERSIALVEAALPDLRRSGLTTHLGNHLTNLATYKFTLGDAAGAETALLEGLTNVTRDGSYWHACALQVAADWLVSKGRVRDAALLLGFVDKMILIWPDGRQGTELDQRERLGRQLGDALGPGERDRLLALGADMSLFEADQLSGLAALAPGSPLAFDSAAR